MKSRIIDSIDFDSALKLQIQEKENVKSQKSKGTIFLLEHNPAVITYGRHANKNNLLVRKDFIEKNGYEMREVSRGGDFTVHEPGQIVGYIVAPLRLNSVKAFVEGVLNIIKNVLLSDFNLKTIYYQDKAGLWIDNKKICSVGFDLRGRVSMHGFALNVNNTMQGFSYVIPCGLTGISMTSVSKETARYIDIKKLKTRLGEAFIEHFLENQTQ